MSPIETFFIFGSISTFAVAGLATWLRFTNKRSSVERA